eukprot:scaffold78463_cov28-Tisochrysis_lutea.AAC.6
MHRSMLGPERWPAALRAGCRRIVATRDLVATLLSSWKGSSRESSSSESDVGTSAVASRRAFSSAAAARRSAALARASA